MAGGDQKRRERAIDWSAVAFVASLCLMAFLYGFASNELDLPPKAQMRQAISALKAVSLIEDDLPTGVTRIDAQSKAGPAVRPPGRGSMQKCPSAGGLTSHVVHCCS